MSAQTSRWTWVWIASSVFVGCADPKHFTLIENTTADPIYCALTAPATPASMRLAQGERFEVSFAATSANCVDARGRPAGHIEIVRVKPTLAERVEEVLK